MIGCGHVGMVTAACLAELGHQVVGVDINPTLIGALRAGQVPVREPGLDALVWANCGRGRLAFTTSYAEARRGAEFIILCVNTSTTVTGAADLRYVRRAVSAIAAALPPAAEWPLLVNKSTSPIGMGKTIEAILRNEGAIVNRCLPVVVPQASGT